MKAWVALTYFQQLDESFVKLLGDLTEEKMGSNGRTSLEIEGGQRGCLPSMNSPGCWEACNNQDELFLLGRN
ncbi:unnamed protein product [Prunus armeniaca]